MAQFDDIISKVKEMKVTELAELVKALEEEFGVSAAIPVAAAGAAVGEEVEEKSEFDVVLTDAGSQKIQVIKVIREAVGLGLKEAKEMTEETPKVIKTGVKKEEAEEMKKKFEGVGAKIELK
jgi:large subunit ribosomal protein L7/L12